MCHPYLEPVPPTHPRKHISSSLPFFLGSVPENYWAPVSKMTFILVLSKWSTLFSCSAGIGISFCVALDTGAVLSLLLHSEEERAVVAHPQTEAKHFGF